MTDPKLLGDLDDAIAHGLEAAQVRTTALEPTLRLALRSALDYWLFETAPSNALERRLRVRLSSALETETFSPTDYARLLAAAGVVHAAGNAELAGWLDGLAQRLVRRTR